MEGRVIGLLRSNEKGGGTATQGPATADIAAGEVGLLTLSLPAHTAGGGQCLSVNDRSGATSVLVTAGKFSLHQCWCVSAAHPNRFTPCKAVSSEFAPDPALDPLWISYFEPFHGAIKKDFGLQVILKAICGIDVFARGCVPLFLPIGLVLLKELEAFAGLSPNCLP